MYSPKATKVIALAIDPIKSKFATRSGANSGYTRIAVGSCKYHSARPWKLSTGTLSRNKSIGLGLDESPTSLSLDPLVEPVFEQTSCIYYMNILFNIVVGNK